MVSSPSLLTEQTPSSMAGCSHFGTAAKGSTGEMLFSEMLSDEGVTWIRGHHDVDAPEVKALLAAFVLQ